MAGAVGLMKGNCGARSNSDELRVLRCGHQFRVDILNFICAFNKGIIRCPLDGTEDRRRICALPKPDQFHEKVLNTFEVDEGSADRTSSWKSSQTEMETGDLGIKICGICLDSDDFRVLQCGHPICVSCLEAIQKRNQGTIRCPFDASEDERKLCELPRPNKFKGKIFYHTSKDIPDFQMLFERLAEKRKVTIQHLRDITEILKSHEFNCAISKITGSVVGITGSVVAIVGISLSLTGFLAFVGVPMAITGSAVATAGGMTTAGSAIAEAYIKRNKVKDIKEDLNEDRFRSEQIAIILERAKDDTELAKLWNINPPLVANISRLCPALAKIAFTTAAGARLAFGIGRAAVTTSLHVLGLVFAAAAIPLDLFQMIESSIMIHKKKPSHVVKELIAITDSLEHVLRKYLMREGFFRSIFTTDAYWAYINIEIKKKANFEIMLLQGPTLNELREFGEIVESGADKVPEEIEQRMYNEWLSYCEDYYQLIHTSDGYWACIEIHGKKRALFKEKLCQGCTMNELKEFGEIVDSGNGRVPTATMQQIYNLRNSRCEDHCQLIYTNDGHWARIKRYARKKGFLEERLIKGITLDELEEFGEIVESGEGEISKDIEQRMLDERYSYFEDHFQLLYTSDGHWACIRKDPRKKIILEERVGQGIALNELEEFGEVVESGEGKIPAGIEQRMLDERYLHCEDHCQLLCTIDGYWACIRRDARKKALLEERLCDGITLDELQEFGDIVESGEGDVPTEIEQRILDERY